MDIHGWLGQGASGEPINAEQRAIYAARRIARNPSVITVKRAGVGPQVVRIEYSTSAVEQGGVFSVVGTDTAIVFGIKDHPALPDTNLRRGDRFFWKNSNFEVVSIVYGPGEIQAGCQARST